MVIHSNKTSLLLCLALLCSPLFAPASLSAPALPQLAYTLNGALWTARADGSERHRLTPYSVSSSPELSPDGRLVAYESIAAVCSPPRPAGSDGPAPMPNLLSVVLAFVGGHGWSTCGNSPSWSPNSRQLAYFDRETLIVRSADGRGARILLEPDRFYGYIHAIWSPDSRQMAVPLYGPGSGLFQDRTLRLAIVPLHGPVRRITIRFPAGSLGANNWASPRQPPGSFPTYSHLSWTREARHLLVETLANANVADLTGIWEAPAAGGFAHLISGTPAAVQGRTRPIPALDHATGFALSPDGTRLATDPYARLWVGDLTGHHGRLLTPAGCPLQQVRWLADGSGLAYIATCTHGATNMLATIRLARSVIHVLVRSGQEDIDLDSPFLCISCA